MFKLNERFVKKMRQCTEYRTFGGLKTEQNRQKFSAIEAVDMLIMLAVGCRASDIHFEPLAKNARVRFRIDGILQEVADIGEEVFPSVVSRIKILSNINIAEKRLPQDGSFNMIVKGSQIDMRAATMPTINGEKVVVRILERNGAALDVDSLEFSKENLHTYKELYSVSNGMVLLTGPTGSGKTTTLYAALNELNDTEKNIITLEDPVEYILQGTNQISINNKAGLTFANGLRSVLRQDPDIIMVGEIRDKETAEIAVHAALTGHLVLSTMHTNDAVGAIARLSDMGIDNFLIASALRGVVAQRLVRSVCPHCKELYEPDEHERTFLGLSKDAQVQLVKAVGCEHCNFSGYYGRIALQEVLKINKPIKNCILQNASEDEISAENRKSGSASIKDDAVKKILDGKTTVQEILKLGYL